jgi:hypothetical protein
MRFFKTAAIMGMVIVAVVVLALEPASGASREANKAPCSKAILGGGHPAWLAEAAFAGPVGVDVASLSHMSRAGRGELVAKVPLQVAGSAPVTVSVPPDLRSRVFLYYGRIEGRDGKPTTSVFAARGYGETEFRPCPAKPRTIWPGGMRIKGTGPVSLLVHTGDGAKPLKLNLGRPRATATQ